MEKVVRITVVGRISRRNIRKFKKFKVENLILVKKKDKYWIKTNDRLFRVFFDDEDIVDEIIKGIWEVEGFKLIKKRKKLKIEIYLKRRVKVEDKPKTVIRVSKNRTTAFKGSKIVDEKRFKTRKSLANDTVEFAKKFKKPIIVSNENIPDLETVAALNGINVVRSYSRGINFKPLLLGLTLILALAAVVAVYYSSFGVATITVEKKLDVSVNLNDVILFAPGMGTKDLGEVYVTVYGDPTDYRLILQLVNLDVPRGCRIIAVQVWDGNNLRGILTPITPSLIIDEYSSSNKTYKLKVFYITMRPCTLKIAIQASVELLQGR